MTTEPIGSSRLLDVLRSYRSTAVALSGGVDSAVVAWAAFQALGPHAVAVTADSASVARRDLEDAGKVARFIGIRHEVLATREFDNPDYLKNDGSRCYFCKSELYDRIVSRLPELGVETICSGANLDDFVDYRPGLKAAAERQIRHPLKEAGLNKAAVRELARQAGLPVWDKPASPCLSSRLAPGLSVTPERTARIEAAEAYLRQLGLRDCRVRLHDGELARLEVPLEDITRLSHPETRLQLSRTLKELGFRYITLDLEGFRSGSLNELVDLDIRLRYTPPV